MNTEIVADARKRPSWLHTMVEPQVSQKPKSFMSKIRLIIVFLAHCGPSLDAPCVAAIESKLGGAFVIAILPSALMEWQCCGMEACWIVVFE